MMEEHIASYPSAELPPGGILAQGKIKSITIDAVVIRANGDIEPQGRISGWHTNIFKHIALQARVKYDRLRVNIQRFKKWQAS